MVHETGGFELFRQCLFQLRVEVLLQDDAWKQVADERQEERFVAVGQLGQIHVTHRLHDEPLFRLERRFHLHCAQHAQQLVDVSQSEVVLHMSGNISYFTHIFQPPINI